MYIPKHFEVTDEAEAYAFIEANAFGQLVSQVDGRPFATHLPFMLSEDRQKIIGHLACQNPQCAGLEGEEVLVTLQGPHDYISPVWYGAAGVPTWNYQAVHVYGRCAVFRAPEKLKHLVEALTRKHELALAHRQPQLSHVPWGMEYRAQMLAAIVGFEISISEIQCKYKLSQNRSEQDRSRVSQQLRALGAVDLADSMDKY